MATRNEGTADGATPGERPPTPQRLSEPATHPVVRTAVRAGSTGEQQQHSEPLVVRTAMKAGAVREPDNHSESFVW